MKRLKRTLFAAALIGAVSFTTAGQSTRMDIMAADIVVRIRIITIAEVTVRIRTEAGSVLMQMTIHTITAEGITRIHIRTGSVLMLIR